MKGNAAGVEAGHINIGLTSKRETLELDAGALEAQRDHAEALRKVEMQALASRLAVPTDDGEVKESLKLLGHPIILYGENEADRRARLRQIMTEAMVNANPDMDIAGFAGTELTGVASLPGALEKDVDRKKKETFYYPASPELVQARSTLMFYTFSRAALRRKESITRSKNMVEANQSALALVKNIRKMSAGASQIGGSRPISSCSLGNVKSSTLVTGSWDGLCSVWDTDTYALHCKMKGHTERVVDVSVCPNQSNTGEGALFFASSSVDGTAILWPRGSRKSIGDGRDAEMTDVGSGLDSREVSIEPPVYIKPLAILTGHQDRLGRLGWHPSGRFLGTTSFDKTWRLWDVAVGKEILLQEGHAREVYDIAFHPDGSLVCTTSLSGNGILWDLRSGKTIMPLCGHAKAMLTADFSPNGLVVATGSMDNTARIWDLRMMKTIYTIPGHTHLVSCVRFSPTSGEFLVTSGYDCLVNVWSARNYHLLKRLPGHEKMVMKVDISSDEKRFYTAGFDRTWKVWSNEEDFWT